MDSDDHSTQVLDGRDEAFWPTGPVVALKHMSATEKGGGVHRSCVPVDAGCVGGSTARRRERGFQIFLARSHSSHNRLMAKTHISVVAGEDSRSCEAHPWIITCTEDPEGFGGISSSSGLLHFSSSSRGGSKERKRTARRISDHPAASARNHREAALTKQTDRQPAPLEARGREPRLGSANEAW